MGKLWKTDKVGVKHLKKAYFQPPGGKYSYPPGLFDRGVLCDIFE